MPDLGARNRDVRPSRPAGSSLLACGLALAGMAPAVGGIAAADTWTPGVSVGTRFDDHRTLGAAPLDLQAGVLAPQLGIDASSEGSRLRVFARRQYEWYPGQLESRLAPAPTADFGTLQAQRAWGSVGGVAIDGRYARSRDRMDVDERSTIAAVTDATHWSATARGALGPLEGDYRLRGWAYASPDLQDALAMSWSATALPRAGATDAWLVGWRQRQLQLGAAWALRQHTAVVGYRRRLSSELSGQIEVGASEAQFADGSRPRGPAFAIALESPRDGEGRPALELRVQRDFATSVTAQVDRGLGSAGLMVRGESLVDVEGGIYRDPNLTRRLVIGVQDTTLSRSTVLGLEMGYARTRPLHLGAPEADLLRATGWAVRRLRPWLTGRMAYSYLRQPGFGRHGEAYFRRIRLEASMSVTP